MSTSILAVAPNRDVLQRLDPLLSREAFEVHEMPTGKASLILTYQQRYNLLLVGYPLPDMGLDQFLHAVHELDSPCADSPVLIVGDDDRLRETEPFVESGYVRVASTSDSPASLQEKASRLLEVAPRVGVRAMVRLEVDIAGNPTTQLAQTRNISDEGMFIATSRDLVVGERVPVQLYLPDDPMPIAAEVEVLRLALPEVEGVAGVGVRFLEVKRGGQLRLHRHIEEQAGQLAGVEAG